MSKIPMILCDKCGTYVAYKNSFFIAFQDTEINLCATCNDKWDDISMKCLGRLLKRWMKKDDSSA